MAPCAASSVMTVKNTFLNTTEDDDAGDAPTRKTASWSHPVLSGPRELDPEESARVHLEMCGIEEDSDEEEFDKGHPRQKYTATFDPYEDEPYEPQALADGAPAPQCHVAPGMSWPQGVVLQPPVQFSQADFQDMQAEVLIKTAEQMAAHARQLKKDAQAARRMMAPHAQQQPALVQQRQQQALARHSPSPAAIVSDMSGMPDQRTTVMLRNLPKTYTRAMLVELLNSEGFMQAYDFVYLPTDFRSNSNFGYAFVNLVTHQVAKDVSAHFQRFTNWVVSSRKVLDVAWSGPCQGFAAHVERYRNSPVMHESNPDEVKPALFQNGKRIAFPAPTKRIRAPRVRNPAKEDASGTVPPCDVSSDSEGDKRAGDIAAGP